jgi:superfamily II DNA or RNA helicase
MSRLASTAKAGFYPTPERITEWIAECVQPRSAEPDFVGRLIDPCCGKGIAAQYLAERWHLEGYGIEIDAERALEASQRLQRVLHLDYASVRTPHHAFQVLFLNPPYDHSEGEGRRMEYVFLRDATKWLQPSGLLIYIVPQYRVDARMAGFLTTAYDAVKVYRFPDEEYADFRQVVIFGLAKQDPGRDDKALLALIQACRGELPILPETWLDEERYTLPSVVETNPSPGSSHRFYFRGNEINPQEALAEASAVGAWKTSEWQAWLSPGQGLAAFHPLMPLKKGHLAMLIAAGLMQNLRLESSDGKESLLVKGRTYKVQEEVESDDENEEVLRDRFVTEIVALDLKAGCHVKIAEPSALAEFVEQWRDVLTNQVMETFVPLYQFDLDAEGTRVQATLNRLSKHRRIPGRKETGLFLAQKHVAVALWKQLQQSNSAILVGEMGTGKTTIASAVSELLRQGGDPRPTLVLVPPHLVNKWMREIQQIVPLAFVMPLYRLSDVTQFVHQVGRLAPGTPAFAVLSREMAKLGSGWRPAYVIRKTYARVPVGQADQTQVETQAGFSCPRCGKSVWYVEAGHETAPVQKPGYFAERKRRCFDCGEPFYQMVHLHPGSQETRDHSSSEARLIDAAEMRASRTQRYPIADFIARHYPKFFKLLVADEIHQLKGQSTDQGYALGALVRACDKTLALTGTIYGGRSTSLFFLLHRLSPEVRAQFKWSEAQRWAERYGLIERVTKYTEGENGYGTYSGKRRRKTYLRELPGASPELAALLLDCTAFLSLTDLGFQLPAYREHPHEIEMSREQRDAYDALQDQLLRELQDRLGAGDKSLLAAYLQSLLAYPNSCFRAEVVEDSNGKVVASAPALLSPALSEVEGKAEGGEEQIFPKEEWLLKLVKAEHAQGRRVLVFCRQTATRDITARLVSLLGRAGLRADVLKASVGTQVREEWLRRRVGKGMLDVLITNPKLVEVGLDLIDFQTTVWYETEWSLYTLMQASRRTWRIGQVQDVDVHFVVYRDTMEHHAASLVGQKLAAAQLLYGDSVEGALVDQADSGHGFLADLARSVIEGTQVLDLGKLFHQVADPATSARMARADGNASAESQFIGLTLPQVSEDLELAEGVSEALQESVALRIPTSAKQMALF